MEPLALTQTQTTWLICNGIRKHLPPPGREAAFSCSHTKHSNVYYNSSFIECIYVSQTLKTVATCGIFDIETEEGCIWECHWT